MVSGLIGGLPVTAVIVRSTANIGSGGKTKVSAIFHGLLILISVSLFPTILNLIPLAALAAILLMVGYKLAKPSLFASVYRQGWNQFIPFIITIFAILFTDLLIGITVGILVGVYFVIKANLHKAISVTEDGNEFTISMQKDVSFLNKAKLRMTLRKMPKGSHVIFDETDSIFIDHDIIETIDDFCISAENNNITVEIRRPSTSDNQIMGIKS